MSNQNLIVKVFEGSNVFFTEDGYINATKTAQSFNKDVRDWLYSVEIVKYINELTNCGKTSSLVIKQRGRFGGTWIHPSLKDEFERWCKSKTSITAPELYVVLFNTGVIKVGKGAKGFSRVKSHISQAQCFGVKTLQFFIEKNPIITEEELIEFCNQNGTLHHGNEYFTGLDYNAVVNFVKRKVERKPLRLVRSNNG